MSKEMESKIIYDKLKKYCDSDNIEDVELRGQIPSSPMKCFAEIEQNLTIMNANRENSAYRIVKSRNNLIGRMIIFSKKVIRRFVHWYVEPVCQQQTKFNNAVTPAIGRMLEMVSPLVTNVNDISKKTAQNEIQINLYSEKVNELEARLEFSDRIIESTQNMLEKLNGLDLDIFKESERFFIKTTSAQSGEDSICAYVCRVLGIRESECTYLDLGANHAKEMSNTFYFYSKGARGVLVEANPQLIPELKFYRNGDVILNKCIDTNKGNSIRFYILSGDGLSTPDLEQANACIQENPDLEIIDEIQIETITVNEIIENYMGKCPEILNIDIEGNEMEILNSIDFARHRPLLIITEMISYKKRLVVGEKNQKIIEFMQNKEYIEYAYTGINSIFLDKNRVKECL